MRSPLLASMSVKVRALCMRPRLKTCRCELSWHVAPTADAAEAQTFPDTPFHVSQTPPRRFSYQRSRGVTTTLTSLKASMNSVSVLRLHSNGSLQGSKSVPVSPESVHGSSAYLEIMGGVVGSAQLPGEAARSAEHGAQVEACSWDDMGSVECLQLMQAPAQERKADGRKEVVVVATGVHLILTESTRCAASQL